MECVGFETNDLRPFAGSILRTGHRGQRLLGRKRAAYCETAVLL